MRSSSSCLGVLALLAACATGPAPGHRAHARDTARARPTFTAPFAAAATPTAVATPGARDEGDGVATSTLPVGVGFTINPGTVLVGATYDVPIDEHLTIGPSAQYGASSDDKLFTLTAKVKYFLPEGLGGEEGGRPKFQPYVHAGVGLLTVDPEGHSSESGAVVAGGAGMRYLTGKDYRLGTEATINFPIGDVSDQNAFFSWEVLQVVFNF